MGTGAAKDIGTIITVEDHNAIGGLGDAVAAVIAEENLNVKFKKLGLPNYEFPTLGSSEEIYAYYGFDSMGISKEVKKMLNK